MHIQFPPTPAAKPVHTYSVEEVPAINEGGIFNKETVDLPHVGSGTGQHPLSLQRVNLIIVVTRCR